MRCKCTVKDNYEIIGICNTNKMSPMINTEAWTQLSIPQVVVMPEDRPDIEDINKVYNKVEITSTNIIGTPCADIPNAEGLSLTGKKLIVEGNICQTVIYTSKTACQSVHPAHFKIPFCSYIVIDPDTDIELDKYCVAPCIEDVYAQILSERLIFMNITVFLLARKQQEGC